MSAHEVPGWYEAGLPVRERKRRGHFSTPPELVELILDACGYTPEHDLSALRVLDPACGSGNFLAAAARRLLLFGQQHHLPPAETIAALQHNLWGLDPDPVACFLAEMQMRTMLADHFPQSIVSGLHIHQGDGLVLPWHESQNIDLFLANPPYLAAKNTDLSGYHSARQRGQADSYLLFVSLALQVVRPAGWLALVLPDPVLARANATQERQRLLSETTIHHLWHLAGVFSAHVGAVVIIAQKRAPTRVHQIPWIRDHWWQLQKKIAARPESLPHASLEARPTSIEPVKKVALDLLLKQPQRELCYLLGDVRNPLIQHLHAHFCDRTQKTLLPLGDLVLIRRGEELSKDAPLLLERCPDDELQRWHPVLRGGGDVRPYVMPEVNGWLAREHIKKPLERYRLPKLLVVKSTGQLQATLDLQGYVVLQTLYLLYPRLYSSRQLKTDGEVPITEEMLDELYFLLALLNSRLLREYVYVLHTAYKWVQPQIEQHVLAHLPVPVSESVTRAEIVERAKQLYACSALDPVVELKKQLDVLYEEQEQAICALYAAALPASYATSLPVASLTKESRDV
ncbi:MAG TPA: N-6 DNA methylase [Ktedonobacteraceae bacterium]|jgi:SAM-dependent methyltransferase|nr:N-6 DNA methylase [Ktedonobacteraceae bacterium]